MNFDKGTYQLPQSIYREDPLQQKILPLTLCKYVPAAVKEKKDYPLRVKLRARHVAPRVLVLAVFTMVPNKKITHVKAISTMNYLLDS